MTDYDRFVSHVTTTAPETPIFIGIDPGSEGAVGFVCHRYHTAVDIPTLKVKRGKGKKTVFNYLEIIRLFRPLNTLRERIHVALEVPPPSMGPNKGSAYAQFRLGVAYGIWPLFLLQKGFAAEEVQPGVWKKAMSLSSDKETSRHAAIKMFPYAPLSRKKDHNRAEALLLAEWLRRRHNGGKK
jgi:crossover junction endodeoxyribonuclease RuvC